MDKKIIIQKLGAFSIGPIVGALINFVTTPMITHFISVDEYGKANMFTVAISIIEVILFLGMDQAYVKRFYETKNKSSLFVNALFPSFLVLTVFEIIFFSLKDQIGIWLFDSAEERICVYALLALLPGLLVERFLLLSIRMSQRGKLYSIVSIISKALILLLTVFCFLLYEKSYRSVVLGRAYAQMIFAVFLWFILRKELEINPGFICWKEIKSLLKYGLPLLPTTVIGWVLTGMDKVMLRVMGTFEQLGLYGVAAKVAAVLTLIQACFATFWVPLAHQWNNEGVNKNRFVKAGNYISCVMSITFAVILLFKDLIFTLFGQGYEGGTSILPFLLFTPIMYTISEVTVMGIYFSEKTMLTVIISVISASINLILNILLIPILGPNGAAIATGFSYISFFWARTLLSRKVWFKFPLRRYFLMTVILVTDALLSTFSSGKIVAIGNLFCIFILFFLYSSEIKELLLIGIDMLKMMRQRVAEK